MFDLEEKVYGFEPRPESTLFLYLTARTHLVENGYRWLVSSMLSDQCATVYYCPYSWYCLISLLFQCISRHPPPLPAEVYRFNSFLSYPTHLQCDGQSMKSTDLTALRILVCCITYPQPPSSLRSISGLPNNC